MARKTVLQTKVVAETQVALIVSQVLVAAAIAIPLGLFAAAIGVLSARSSTGQVRIAVTMNANANTNTNLNFNTNSGTTPPSLLPAPVIADIGTTYARLRVAPVAGALQYNVYANGAKMVTYSATEVIGGYLYVNYLTPSTWYWFDVGVLLASAGDPAGKPAEKKTGSTGGKTAAADATCTGGGMARKSHDGLYPKNTDGNMTNVCSQAKSKLPNEILQIACVGPATCKRYCKPYPNVNESKLSRGPIGAVEGGMNEELTGLNSTGMFQLACDVSTAVQCFITVPSGWTPCPGASK
ncbi:MAG: hypothetical protein PHI63_03930 [Patescibacteria group bacterium]|nr:hypothetical protein [Patescibacteria group bacterium]